MNTLPPSAKDLPELDAEEYRVLFDAMDEGYCVIEFFDGPHGPDSDYIHIAANDAYAENAGIPDVVGQKLREMVPDEADAWVARYGEVLRTGKPIRFAMSPAVRLPKFPLGTDTMSPSSSVGRRAKRASRK